MDSTQSNKPNLTIYVWTYLVTAIPIILLSHILAGWLTGILTPVDIEYIEYLERNDGVMFYGQLYRSTRLHLTLFGVFIGNIGYFVYFIRQKNTDIPPFLISILKYSIIGFVGGIVFYVIGALYASIQYPWTATPTTAGPSTSYQKHHTIETYVATLGVGISTLCSMVWERYKSRKDKRKDQQEEFLEIKKRYLEARGIKSKDNLSESSIVPDKYDISSSNSIEDREQKLESFDNITEKYVSISDIIGDIKDKLEKIPKKYEEKVERAESLIGKARSHISKGNEDKLDTYEENLLAVSDDLDNLIQKEKVLNKMRGECNDDAISVPLMKSINEIQLDNKFEQQLQLHEEMFDAYAKVERISHPHLSNSRNRLREDMIYFVLVSEEGHLEKGEAIELIKIAEGMEEFVSFSEAHNPEYTEITIEHLIDQIRLAVDENNYNIMSEGIEKMHTIKKSVWELDDLYEYSWSDFEYLIANLWKSKGYDTHIGSQVADKGIDVTATKENEDIAIQVKQFSQDNKVGSRVIRNTGGVLPRGFDKVVVVTSSSFTSPAKDEATDYGDGMELINGHELVQELNDSNLTPPAE